jgi:hypothetical protein
MKHAPWRRQIRALVEPLTVSVHFNVEVAADLRASPQISTEFTSASTRRRRAPPAAPSGSARGTAASSRGPAQLLSAWGRVLRLRRRPLTDSACAGPRGVLDGSRTGPLRVACSKTSCGAAAAPSGLARLSYATCWRRCRVSTRPSTAPVDGLRPTAPVPGLVASSSGLREGAACGTGRCAAASLSGLVQHIDRRLFEALSRLHEVQHSACRRAAPDCARAGPRGVLVGSCTGRRLCNWP